MIKNDIDIVGIKECCRIVAAVLNYLQNFIEPGISTKDIEEASAEIINYNSAMSAFKGYTVPGLKPYPGIVCTSVNSCIVHGIPNRKIVLREGDIVGVDVGVKKNGYFGDAARTYAVGSISEKAKRLMQITEEALKKGIAQAKDGHKVGDISYAIGSFIKTEGYFAADSLTGHGVGINLHEEPMIPNIGERNRGPTLYKGMTIAIEPMINIGTNKVSERGWEFYTADKSLSAHFEHTILVTDNEPMILTK